jgi:uncharacterized protein (TIRG00374 family)
LASLNHSERGPERPFVTPLDDADERDGAREITTGPPRSVTVLRNIFGAIILVGFVIYLWEHREQFVETLEVRTIDLAVLGALTLSSWAAVAAQNCLLYRAMGLEFGFAESFVISSASGFGNYLPFRPGTLLRAHYLKRVRGLRYTHFGSVFVVRTVFFTATTGVTGLLCLAWISWRRGAFSAGLGLAFLALAIAPVTTLLCIPKLSAWAPRRLRHLALEFHEGVHQIRGAVLASVLVVILVLVQFFLLGARLHIAARAVGSDLEIVVFVLLAVVGTLMGFIALTPGSLGIREAVMGYVTFALGDGFAQGAYVGVIDRAVSLALTATIGAAAFLFVWRRLASLEDFPGKFSDAPANDAPISPPG